MFSRQILYVKQWNLRTKIITLCQNHRITGKYHTNIRELNTINENIYMLILTGFKNRLCHGPGERSAHRPGKPANEYNSNPGNGKCGIENKKK